MSSLYAVSDLLAALAAVMRERGVRWYLSPEDLIVTKILAGRPKDIEDIRGVIHERNASLEVARIRAVLRLLERALTQSDLLPVFERE